MRSILELVLRIFNNIKESHMNTKVLTTLEYTKIIDLLTEKADSEPGKKLCRELVPSTSEQLSGRPKMPWPVFSVLEAPLLAATEI